MCTLVVATRLWPDLPLLVAANRDEQLARPAEPPRIRTAGPLKSLAPRDLEAGGTWIGLNERGVVAAITNRYGVPPDPHRRSRGALVTAALEEPTAAAAASRVAALPAADYNPFHLLVADRVDASVVWSDGGAMHSEHVPPGTAVISERSFGAAPTDREAWLRGQVPHLLQAGPPDDPTLKALMATHRTPPFESVCVHLADGGYGTRTTTIVRLGPDDATYAYSDGPPCTAPLTDVSHLIDAMA